eukprot:1155466-Rhodomonas_salina.3
METSVNRLKEEYQKPNSGIWAYGEPDRGFQHCCTKSDGDSVFQTSRRRCVSGSQPIAATNLTRACRRGPTTLVQGMWDVDGNGERGLAPSRQQAVRPQRRVRHHDESARGLAPLLLLAP